MSEKDVERRILAECNGSRTRLFKNETGMAYRWIGDKAVPIKYGLCVGSSDLIGFTVVNGIAVFCAFEVKTEKGRMSPEQQRFVDMVVAHGGIAGRVGSAEDVDSLVQEYRERIVSGL